MFKEFFELLPVWVSYPLILMLVLSGFLSLLIAVWGTLAALEKIWRVVRYGEPLSWTDPLYWLIELPKKTRKGLRIQHAIWTLNGAYDLIRLDDPVWWVTEDDLEEARNILREEGFTELQIRAIDTYR